MTIGGESGVVQNPFLRYAEEAGWTYLSPDDALALRRGLTSPVLDSVLIDQLQALNPGIVGLEQAEQLRDQIVRVRPTIEGNFDAWEFLKGLKTVFVEAENRERNVRLFHPTDLTVNLFQVTDEFTFSNGTPPVGKYSSAVRLNSRFFQELLGNCLAAGDILIRWELAFVAHAALHRRVAVATSVLSLHRTLAACATMDHTH